MRSMRRVGVWAAAVVVVVGAAGCGGGDGGGGSGKDRRPSSSASSSPEPAVDEDLAEDEPTADEYLDTPESMAFDEKAAGEGLEVEGYAQPSEYVLMMCESMDAWEPGAGETLAKNHVPDMTDGEKRALREGSGSLCPKYAKEIRAALGGKAATRTMSSGTYRIVKGAGLGEDVAPPGTYRTSGDLEDCYWERTKRDGTVIDNQFATAAKEIRVTVRAGELFTSRDCGTWALAG
ncbi:hypothetical protein ACFV27_37250 [Streptomyces antimycoticus]|uniref:hypothetical protein n=1 Tax=Streptomyces antimycoticus TaxID=68175 RepID=UPI0036A59E62